ncbi:hypothetical protein M433DRAFT_6421 [Acidomyces richmondensis BFW]|nr:MAG: hypothetical protein FE78DRAFT_34905 [Acidomyces sp. 'richmondensis']KYG43313.1 hypothetical protein M433DRAFT_6421 [Acidomyces richmondensis BFW]
MISGESRLAASTDPCLERFGKRNDLGMLHICTSAHPPAFVAPAVRRPRICLLLSAHPPALPPALTLLSTPAARAPKDPRGAIDVDVCAGLAMSWCMMRGNPCLPPSPSISPLATKITPRPRERCGPLSFSDRASTSRPGLRCANTSNPRTIPLSRDSIARQVAKYGSGSAAPNLSAQPAESWGDRLRALAIFSLGLRCPREHSHAPYM